jgi:biotin synthase
MVRMIATARILMPKSFVRLSAGRLSLSDEAQALCFLAGANSIFMGEKLLTTPNPEADADRKLFDKLGMRLIPQNAVTHAEVSPANVDAAETSAHAGG